MSSKGSNYSEPSWFAEAPREPAANELAMQELAHFLRAKASRRPLSDDPSVSRSARVYWYHGTESDFLERVPHRLGKSMRLMARTSLFDYEQPQHSGQALVEWVLSGEALPSVGARFRVFDLKAQQWIGAGRVEEDRDAIYAFLVAGLWSDFYRYEKDCSGLVLVIFDSKQGVGS